MGKIIQTQIGQAKGAFSLPETTAVEQNEKHMLITKGGADILAAPRHIVDLKTKLLSRCCAKKIKTFFDYRYCPRCGCLNHGSQSCNSYRCGFSKEGTGG